MFARETMTNVQPDKVDEAISLWRDSVLPAARQQKGFNGGYLLTDRSTGKGIAIGFWETEADLKASGEASPYFREQMAKFAGLLTGAPVIENYEVSVQA